MSSQVCTLDENQKVNYLLRCTSYPSDAHKLVADKSSLPCGVSDYCYSLQRIASAGRGFLSSLLRLPQGIKFRCNPHRLVSVKSIIGSTDWSTHLKFHYVHNSWISLHVLVAHTLCYSLLTVEKYTSRRENLTMLLLEVWLCNWGFHHILLISYPKLFVLHCACMNYAKDTL